MPTDNTTGAAPALPRAAAAPDDRGVTSLPAELEAIAGALRAAAEACDGAAGRLVSGGAVDASICDRYNRAADGWPVAPPPSRERLAALLAGLHDAAAIAHRAARRCEHAKRLLDAALHRPDDAPRCRTATLR